MVFNVVRKTLTVGQTFRERYGKMCSTLQNKGGDADNGHRTCDLLGAVQAALAIKDSYSLSQLTSSMDCN
uniref:Pectinesterase n=1 Tax=Steinernema glaseri TaxID=37863 RepID=A0A1I7ZC23_9BILA